MRQWQPLTERQLEVLRWVADGAPATAFSGNGHKAVANALQNRRLVSVSRRGGIWTADLTSAGRYYLDHGSYAPPGVSLPPVHQVKPVAARGTERKQPAERPRRPARPKPPTAAQQLVIDVIAAGGRLRLPNRIDGRYVSHDSLVRKANRATNLPTDHWLKLQHRSDGVEVLLRETPGTRIPQRPVPIPDKISKLHPVVARYRDTPDIQEVFPEHLPRALTLLHALAAECDRRGYAVEWARDASCDRRDRTDGQFLITVGGHTYQVRIHEKRGAKGEMLNWQLASTKRLPGWRKAAHYSYASTGLLQITVERGYGRCSRTAVFAEGKTIALGDKLPNLLRELEIRAAEDEESRQEAEVKADRLKEHWEAALKRAATDHAQAHLRQVLEEQVDLWHRADRFRAYLGAMRRKINEVADPEARRRAVEWLQWAEKHVEATDPLECGLQMPDVPAPSRHDLIPFMGGLNPFHPPKVGKFGY